MLRWALLLIDFVTAVLLAAVAILALAQVVARYLLGLSLPWSEELLRLLFVWLVMLGAARTQHLKVDALETLMSPRIRQTAAIFSGVLSAALLVLLIVRGSDLIELTVYDRFTALPLSVQWLYWSLVIGSLLWLAHVLVGTAYAIMGRRAIQ